MGQVFSCCYRAFNFNKEERVGLNERTKLISQQTKSLYRKRNDWRNSRSQIRSIPNLVERHDQNCKNNNTNKSVEKSLAKKVVDITSIDRPIDESEYKDRIKIYEKRMSRINKPLVLRSTIISESLRTEHVYRHYNPIEVEDFELITDLSERASQAVLNGFKIDSIESIVIPLNSWDRI